MMNREILTTKIVELGGPDTDTIVKWVQSLPKDGNYVIPDKIKVGDVFMHPMFKHPYVLLKRFNDEWVCCLMTTNAEFENNLEACKSRFFPTSYFTKHLFIVKEPLGAFMAPYENARHLTVVYNSLLDIMGNGILSS